MDDKTPLLNHNDFNALTSTIFNNNYDSGSADVLRAEIHKAQAAGDTRAEAAARRDYAKTGVPMNDNGVLVADASDSVNGFVNPSPSPSTTNTSTSPVDEARTSLVNLTRLSPDLESAIFSGDQQRSAAIEQVKTNMQDAAASQARSIAIAGEADVSRELLHHQLIKALGFDVTDPNSALSQEMQREAQARGVREGLDRELSGLEGINFWQNPFAFIASQPRIQQLTGQYNNAARIENTSNEEIARLQVLTENVLKMTPAKNADLIRAKAVEDANMAVKTAAAKAAEYTAANAAGHAKSMMDVFATRHEMFQSILGVQSLEEGIADRRERQADLQENRKDRAERQKEIDDAKTEEKNRTTALVVGINTYRKAINGSSVPDFTPEDIKRMPAEIKTAWYNVILRGNYGNDYNESIPFIKQFGNPVSAAQDGNATMMQILRSVEMKAQAAVPEIINREKLKNPMSQIKPQQALEMAYNELFNKDAASAAPGSDKGNVKGGMSPYALDFDAAAALSKTQKTPSVLGKTLIAAKELAGYRSLNDSYTPSMLLNGLEARVVSGEVSAKDAAEQLSRFIALTSANSYNDNGLRYFALPQPKDWFITPGAVGTKRVDLMNTTQLENYFTSRISAAKVRNTATLQTMDPFGNSNIFNTDAGEGFGAKKPGAK